MATWRTRNQHHKKSYIQCCQMWRISRTFFLFSPSTKRKFLCSGNVLICKKFSCFGRGGILSSYTRLSQSTPQTRHIALSPQNDPKDVMDKNEILKIFGRAVWPSGSGSWSTRRLVLISLACLFGSKGLTVSAPILLKMIIDSYNEGNALLTIDTPLSVGASWGAMLILSYAAARAGSSLLNESRNAIFAKVAMDAIRNIAKNVFLHLHVLDLDFHLTKQTGSLAKAIDRGTRGMNFILNALVFNVGPTSIEILLVAGIMWHKCGLEFMLTSLGFVTSYVLWTFLVTNWRTKFRHQMNKADNEAANKAVDSLINYETVKYFNNEQYEAEQYDAELKNYEEASLKTSRSLALLNFGQNFVISSAIGISMYLAARGIQIGAMTVGDIVMVNALLIQLSMPLNFLGSVYRDIRQGLIDMQNMIQLLKFRPKIQEIPNAFPLILKEDNSNVSFENVTFGYLDGAPVLNSLSFSAPTGKKTAIVGGSGSGKSTIIRLLYRFYDVGSGRILVGGKDIRDVTLESLRQNIAVVPQDCVLFHNSIFYNIKYGRMHSNSDDVRDVSRLVELDDAVLKMPSAYQTLVGERGLKLSGGEKQRIGIARALLKDAPIIAYDEATSSLDAVTEQAILQAFRASTTHRTSIFIAHRLATVADAHRILVLESGGIIEEGDHLSLINADGKYAQLWRSQSLLHFDQNE